MGIKSYVFMRIKSFLMTNTAVVMFFINALGKTIKIESHLI